MSDIILEVNGIRYKGFTGASVFKSMESICGKFQFQTTIKDSAALTFSSDLKVQDAICVYVDDNKIISGYIENLNISYSADSHSIDVAGRDSTGDLVDSSIIKKQYSQRDFVTLCKAVLKDNGYSIDVIDNVGSLTLETTEVIKTESGDTIASFLDRYAKKLQVLFTTDSDGDLVISREGSDLSLGTLTSRIDGSNNNIISANVNISTLDRFRNIDLYSQSNNDDFYGATTSQSASQTDTEVRSPRRRIITMDTASLTSSLSNLAKWNVNIRRARGAKYECKVQGFYTFGDVGALWVPNTLVSVNDERCQVVGQFLIQSVNYNYTIESGRTTDLTIVNLGSFSLTGAPLVNNNNFGDALIATP